MKDETKAALPDGWRWVKLGEVCETNPKRPNLSQRPLNAPTSFVPMPAVDERSGSIARIEHKPYELVKKGYTYFANGDVLFAKITPCMQNGKHAIATDLTDGIGFGSTEFHVLRPNKEITAEWIHFFLRQPSVMQEAASHFEGSVGQQRVPIQFLQSLELALPPVIEQRRWAKLMQTQLTALEEARAAAEAQLETLKMLPAALLRAAFDGTLGLTVTSPPEKITLFAEAHKWPRKKLGELCEIKYGVGLPAPRRRKGTVAVYGSNGLVGSHCEAVTAGPTIIIGRKGSIGEIHFSQEPCWPIDTTYFIDAVDKAISLDWLYYGLMSLDLRTLNKAAAIPGLNRDDIYAKHILFPTLAEQKRMAFRLHQQLTAAAEARTAAEAQLTALRQLPASLLQQAFAPMAA